MNDLDVRKKIHIDVIDVYLSINNNLQIQLRMSYILPIFILLGKFKV
jgi:hypothetical protein